MSNSSTINKHAIRSESLSSQEQNILLSLKRTPIFERIYFDHKRVKEYDFILIRFLYYDDP